MKTIQAQAFKGSIKGGSSRPVVVEGADGENYFVKTHGSGQGMGGLICEALATMLARHMRLPVLECKEVILDNEFGAGVLDAELRETLAASAGSNLAFDYLEAAVPFDIDDPVKIPTGLKDDLFLFDLALLNVDRTGTNTNLLVLNSSVISIDYGACLRLLAPQELPEETRLNALKILRGHPFYRGDLEVGSFGKRMASIGDEVISGLVNSIPEAWFASDSTEDPRVRRKEIESRTREVVANAAWLDESLKTLRQLDARTKQSHRETARANRDRFMSDAGLEPRGSD